MRQTEKQRITEAFVDEYIKTFNFPPTYKTIQEHFGLSACAAHARCRNFRNKMKSHLTKPSAKQSRISFTYYVTNEKMDEFMKLQKQIGNLLSNETADES